MHGKIYASMYTGSMVGAGAMAFALMPYAIANARPDEGCTVDLNPSILSTIFGETEDNVLKAIEFLCSPDPKSRSPEHEGRRLVHVGPGPFRYFVVNLENYRQVASDQVRTEYWRQYKQWVRTGRKGAFKFSQTNVHSGHCGRPQMSKNVPNAYAGTCTVPPLPPLLVHDVDNTWNDEFGNLIPEHLRTVEFKTALAKWYAYKRERREAYKPIGASGCIQKLARMGTVDMVIAAIENSIGNNWQGIFPPRADNGSNGRSIPPHVQLRAVEEQINSHIANKDSVHFDASCPPAKRTELKGLRLRAEALRALVANGGSTTNQQT